MARKESIICRKLCIWIGSLGVIISIVISVLIAGNAYRVYDYVWHGDQTPVTMFYVFLNKVMTGRIRTLVENDGFEGTMENWRLFSPPENNYFFDMGWVRLFYWYGIIPACIFITVMFLLMIYCCKRRNYAAFVLIVSFSFYSIIEAHTVSVFLARNYVFFLIGAYWSEMLCWNREKKIHNKKNGT